jgi:hypothetical protein
VHRIDPAASNEQAGDNGICATHHYADDARLDERRNYGRIQEAICSIRTWHLRRHAGGPERAATALEWKKFMPE